LVLESNLWLVHWSLFFHQLLGSGISVTWIFSWSSAMALCLSACSCTDLMLQLLYRGTSEMFAWTLSWDPPNCILSAVAIGNTNSRLVLRRQWWMIWPVQHSRLPLSWLPIYISWGTA
jgi:hypothetical protein